jgi:hypothetical protein
MIFDPEWERKKALKEQETSSEENVLVEENAHEPWNFLKDVKVLERLKSIKEKMFLKMAERRANKLIANRD